MPCIFTIDVEDWFHILDIPGGPTVDTWATLESRVERNFLHLLDLVDEQARRATCFFLGWVAERFPHLVREADRRGHEIASHGYAHRLVYELSRAEFRADVERSRKILQDISGRDVLGFRAPGFSVTEKTPWFFDEVAKSGYGYDSSIFPAPRGHGGLKTAVRDPFTVRTSSGAALVEFPMTVVDIVRPLCVFGGGYLRLSPWPVIRSMTTGCLRAGRTVVFYVHPREIDVDHPRLPMSPVRTFKSYVNLGSTERKLMHILKTFPCSCFREAFESMLADPVTQQHGLAVAAGSTEGV